MRDSLIFPYKLIHNILNSGNSKLSFNMEYLLAKAKAPSVYIQYHLCYYYYSKKQRKNI